LEHADQRLGCGKEQFAEHQSSNDAVEEKIVPFDGGTDRAGDNSSAQLAAMGGLGQRARQNVDQCHGKASLVGVLSTDIIGPAPITNCRRFAHLWQRNNVQVAEVLSLRCRRGRVRYLPPVKSPRKMDARAAEQHPIVTTFVERKRKVAPASRRQDVKQSLRLLQIARVEPLHEPPVNRSQQFARFAHLALVTPKASEAHRGTEFP
jgi:hypothetical protein